MADCLTTKKAECKNCYKCIRHCPIKSLKFTDGQAKIISSECVLCGSCYVVCPQEAKEIRDDSAKAAALLEGTAPVYLSLAPSFAAWFEGAGIRDLDKAAKALGFKEAQETALGAAVVKTEYENILKEGKNRILISTCCPSINTLVTKNYPNAIEYLAKVITPMHAHARMIKEADPEAKVIFAGPCISKKSEGDAIDSVDCVLTFEELEKMFIQKGIEVETTDEERGGRTRLFPTSGGIVESMNRDPEITYTVVDGLADCVSALKDIESGNLTNCFIEMSACSGSCINGPLMRRRQRNILKSAVAVKQKAAKEDFEFTMPAHEKLETDFEYNGVSKVKASEETINEILRKMGKNSKDKELNCGSCGYNTCREKAEAVFMGKADLTMCLPYLKEKAESFSDTVINNTPQSIIVLDDQLNIQLANRAAKKLLKIPGQVALAGVPVQNYLDPVDYVIALADESNVYDKTKYLEEYDKYVEETIIYDREFHIIMILMKDITEQVKEKENKTKRNNQTVEIADKVVEKHMRVVQEIASLLGETTAETKVALTRLKETLEDE
ncbi:MAG: [Fe-Fe] hydrogenase large subunit C-terminal domain-containing protein [Clostridiales bacterium]|nr:[Fe-Fe] hydrogenase large subunit C-terminal domain-containing protein [Clostridiales bacterium]